MESACLVITIDGASGTGKGTIGRRLAQHFGLAFLDSGVLYRVLAYAACEKRIDSTDVAALTSCAQDLDVHFDMEKVLYRGQDVTWAIRTEETSKMASKVSQYAPVREALLAWQRAWAKAPGVVADGRDMGTVVFPEANVKFFLHASAEERAERRYLQLREQGISANLAQVFDDIKARDKRDSERSVSPLKAARDARVIETSGKSVDDVFNQVVQFVPSLLGSD